MKTYSTKASDIKREWHVIDASGQVLGDVATSAAKLLMGKHKPMFCRHLDTGDYVVVINAEKIKVTGDKLQQKTYYRHSNYPGGIKSITLGKLMEKYPSRAIEYAVKGMLPHTRLEAGMMKRLKVFAGDVHPYGGQVKTATAAAKEEKS
ncbi:MAG: 50S ribosomal protein L13 [Dehalococcoidales bacterium]|nr:50S ribosomal protein L13 [Dehalococcoidales bacterium]